MESLLIKLLKKKPSNIDMHYKEILRHLEEEKEENHQTNQQNTRMKELFRGHAVRECEGDNF